MKPITRCTFILLVLFVITSTASRADSIVVGSLDLTNTIPGPNGLDTLSLTNVTGSGASNTSLESLMFSNIQLTVDGVDQTGNLYTDLAGVMYELDNLSQDSITSFSLIASLGPSPLWVTVNGQHEEINPTISLGYSGPALDTSVNPDVQFDVDAKVVPEPSTLGLCGTGLALLGVMVWSRRRAQALRASAGGFSTGIA